MILQQIKDAHLAARKARDQVKLTTLTTLIGEITTLEKNQGAVSDKDVTKILGKFVTNAEQVADAYVVRGDTVKRDEAIAEAALYTSFLPAALPQLSADALERVVRSTIASRVAYDGLKPKMGVILSDIKTIHEGAYDPKTAAALVKAELALIPEI